MSVRFVGGPEQAEFMARVRDMDPGRVLLVPVDVGKWTAMAMITDLRGEIIAAPFLFDLTVSGVEHLARRTAGVAADRSAVMCRVGVEAAGHYHRPLVDRLVKDRVEVVELNPYAVKLARSQQLHARRRPTNATSQPLRICWREAPGVAPSNASWPWSNKLRGSRIVTARSTCAAGCVSRSTPSSTWCSPACRHASRTSSTPVPG
jgi:hypothetical protein